MKKKSLLPQAMFLGSMLGYIMGVLIDKANLEFQVIMILLGGMIALILYKNSEVR